VTKSIVFVHGAFCAGWVFDQFKAPFAAVGYDVWAPNLPGHGPDSQRNELSELGLRDHAKALVAALAGFEEPPILVGHSMGGLVCQIAATMTPVAGLIMLAPSPPWGVAATTPEEMVSAASLYALGDFWNRAIDPDYSAAREFSLDRLNKADAKKAYARFIPESGKVLFETMHWAMDATMAAAASADRIKVPILFIAGERDRLNPPSTVRATAARFNAGQAEMHVMPGMSHWIIGEPGWETVAETSLDWLMRTFGPVKQTA
jgi:pimeloyl-ACP methyl ester carboxylesterase